MQSSLLTQRSQLASQTQAGRRAVNSGLAPHVSSPLPRKPQLPLQPQHSRPDVQVAAKGKKGGGTRQMMAGQPMQMAQPPVPPIDPDNAEFVVFIRGRNYMEGKLEVKEGRWVPITIVKGGAAANYLLKAMESEWGRKLYGKTLLRQIGLAIYNDREKIEENVRNSYPPFAKLKSKNFQYAFKIRDKSNPAAWIRTEGITVFPPEEVMKQGTGVESLSKMFNTDSIMQMFQGSS